jgi:hypothetical protein
MRGTTRKYSGGEAASISHLTQRGIDMSSDRDVITGVGERTYLAILVRRTHFDWCRSRLSPLERT